MKLIRLVRHIKKFYMMLYVLRTTKTELPIDLERLVDEFFQELCDNLGLDYKIIKEYKENIEDKKFWNQLGVNADDVVKLEKEIIAIDYNKFTQSYGPLDIVPYKITCNCNE